MTMACSGQSAGEDQNLPSKLNLEVVCLRPENDDSAGTEKRRREIRDLLVQIMMTAKKRGRPKKQNGEAER